MKGGIEMTRDIRTVYTYDSFEYRRELSKRKQQARRRREVRKQIALVVLGIILIIGLSLSYHAIRSNANTDIEEIEYKYFTSVSVNYGETLWIIAEKYADNHYKNIEAYISELMKINNLSSDEIKAGQYLIVPYYSSEFIGESTKK